MRSPAAEYFLIVWTLIGTSQGVVPSLKFCSESSINTYTEQFTLDGTPAVDTSGTKSCKCHVTMQDPLPISVPIIRDSSSSSRTSSSSVCNTRLDVFQSNGTRLQSLHCDWSGFEARKEDLKAGLVFYLHVFDVKEESLLPSTYQLQFETGVKSHLIAHCSPAVPSVTVGHYTTVISQTSMTSSTTSSTSVSTTSARTPVSSASNDTAVIIGVVVGLGFLMLVFISCLLCYIARRPSPKSTIPQIPELPQEQQNMRRPNLLQRTLTRARVTISRARPLPKIPAVIRKFTLRRQVIDRTCQSGYYASIRSDSSNVKNNNNTNNNNYSSNNAIGKTATVTNGHVIQQLSVESSSSYIHPSEINPQVRPNATQQLSIESSASYIHPGDVKITRQENARADDNDTTERKVVCTISDHVANGDKNPYANSPGNFNSNSAITKANDKIEKQNASKPIVPPRPYVKQQKTCATVRDNSFYINPSDVKFPNIDENNDEYVEPEFPVDQRRVQAPLGTDSNANSELSERSDATSGEDCDHDTNVRGSEYENVGPKRLKETSHTSEKPEALEEDKYDNHKRSSANITDSEYENALKENTYLPMNGAQDIVPNGFKNAPNTQTSNNDMSVENESPTDADSSGYLSMKGCEELKDKRNLKKVDSTFPNLIPFSAHGASNRQKDMNKAERQNVNNDLKPNKNKIKRYVKEKRAS